MSRTRTELVSAAQAGDREALTELLAAEQHRIYRYGMKMCGHPEDAADVLQETLLTVARTIGDFRGESSLSTWLYTIARSFCGKQRRRSKYAPTHEDSLDGDARHEALAVAEEGVNPEEAASTGELRQQLQRGLSALDRPYREVLVLRDVEGLSAPEVSNVLGLTVAAVKTRLHRARVALRKTLAPAFEQASLQAQRTPDCPDVLTQLSRHLEGDLSTSACAEMEQHVAKCGGCRSACDSLKHTLALCSRLPTPEVPADVEAAVRQAIQAYLATVG